MEKLTEYIIITTRWHGCKFSILRTPWGLIAIAADRSSCFKVDYPRQPVALLDDWCLLRSFVLRTAPMMSIFKFIFKR